MPEFAYRDAMA